MIAAGPWVRTIAGDGTVGVGVLLETGRVVLRQFAMSDVDTLAALDAGLGPPHWYAPMGRLEITRVTRRIKFQFATSPPGCTHEISVS